MFTKGKGHSKVNSNSKVDLTEASGVYLNSCKKSLPAADQLNTHSREQSHLLAEKACANRGYADFSGLPQSKKLTLTILFQGTASTFNVDRCMGRVAIRAASDVHRVYMVNGIGTFTTDESRHAFLKATQWRGELIASRDDAKHQWIRKSRQVGSGQIMLENAFLALKAIRALGCIPHRINLVGYSRGAVSAIILATLLDYCLEAAGYKDLELPECKLALFDPVASFHNLDPLWVDRTLMSWNPMIPVSGALVFVSLDTLTRFKPQEGSAGSKESVLKLPTNHQGLEGGDPCQQHHQYASLITSFLTIKHFDLVTSKEDDLNLLHATLSLSDIQGDIVLRMRWFAEGQSKRSDLAYIFLKLIYRDNEFRPHGSEFIEEIELNKHTLKHLFIDKRLITTFGVHFSDFYAILQAYFHHESINQKQGVLICFEKKLALLPRTEDGYDVLAMLLDRMRLHFNVYRVKTIREARLNKLLK